DDALVGVAVRRIDPRVVGIVVGVAMPVPAHAVSRSQEADGEVLVEQAAFSLPVDEPAGAARVAQPAVGPFGIVLGDHEGPARLANPYRHLRLVRCPNAVVVDADHVTVPPSPPKHLGQVEHRFVEPHPKKQMVRIDRTDGGRHDREVMVHGKLEKRRAVRVGDLAILDQRIAALPLG
ncbi:MAG: hypothetical protein ACK56I_07875, partial [bacterium]